MVAEELAGVLDAPLHVDSLLESADKVLHGLHSLAGAELGAHLLERLAHRGHLAIVLDDLGKRGEERDDRRFGFDRWIARHDRRDLAVESQSVEEPGIIPA
jgi:hypothetical protein